MVSRSPAAGKSSMPPTAKRVSGKISVVTSPARTAAASWGEPGMAAPCGVNASLSGPPENRSAMVRMARMLSSRIAPWRYSVGPSTTIEPEAVAPLVPLAALTTATNAANRPAIDSTTCRT